MNVNLDLFLALNRLAGVSPATDALIVFFAEYAGWVAVLSVFAFFLFFESKRNPRWACDALFIFAASFAALFATDVIKELVFAPRPFLELSGITVLFEHGENDAFPSGHATFFFALALAFFERYGKKAFVVLFAAAFAIGVARVISGVHWPYDIVAGFLVAWVVVRVLALALRKTRACRTDS